MGEPPGPAGRERPVAAGDAARRGRPLRRTTVVLGQGHGWFASRSHSDTYAADTAARARANATCPPADAIGPPGRATSQAGRRATRPRVSIRRHARSPTHSPAAARTTAVGHGPSSDPGDDDHQGDDHTGGQATTPAAADQPDCAGRRVVHVSSHRGTHAPGRTVWTPGRPGAHQQTTPVRRRLRSRNSTGRAGPTASSQ